MPFSAHIRVPLIPEVSGTLPDQISISILQGCILFRIPPPGGGGIKCKVKLMGKKMQGWGKKIQGGQKKLRGKKRKKGRENEKIKEKSFKQQ